MRACIRCRASRAAGSRDAIGLQVGERGDQRQRVRHPVIDLAQQQFGTVPRLADLPLRGLGLAPEPLLRQGRMNGLAQQFAIMAVDVLPHIVGGTRLQGGHRDPRIVRSGDVDHGYVVGGLAQPRHDVEAGLADQVVVERQRVERLGRQQAQALVAGFGMPHRDALRRQGACGPAARGRHRRRCRERESDRPCQSVAGTCITDRNRPSWRMAWAKLS